MNNFLRLHAVAALLAFGSPFHLFSMEKDGPVVPLSQFEYVCTQEPQIRELSSLFLPDERQQSMLFCRLLEILMQEYKLTALIASDRIKGYCLFASICRWMYRYFDEIETDVEERRVPHSLLVQQIKVGFKEYYEDALTFKNHTASCSIPRRIVRKFPVLHASSSYKEKDGIFEFRSHVPYEQSTLHFFSFLLSVLSHGYRLLSDRDDINWHDRSFADLLTEHEDTPLLEFLKSVIAGTYGEEINLIEVMHIAHMVELPIIVHALYDFACKSEQRHTLARELPIGFITELAERKEHHVSLLRLLDSKLSTITKEYTLPLTSAFTPEQIKGLEDDIASLGKTYCDGLEEGKEIPLLSAGLWALIKESLSRKSIRPELRLPSYRGGPPKGALFFDFQRLWVMGFDPYNCRSITSFDRIIRNGQNNGFKPSEISYATGQACVLDAQTVVFEEMPLRFSSSKLYRMTITDQGQKVEPFSRVFRKIAKIASFRNTHADQLLALAHEDFLNGTSEIEVIHSKTGQLLKYIPIESASIVQLKANASFMVALFNDDKRRSTMSLRIWDSTTFNLLADIALPTSNQFRLKSTGLCFLVGSRLAVAVCGDVWVYDCTTGEQLAVLSRPHALTQFLSQVDRNHMIIAYQDGDVCIWNTHTQKIVKAIGRIGATARILMAMIEGKKLLLIYDDLNSFSVDINENLPL